MSDQMTPERIAEIKARCEAATDGPWVTNYSKHFNDLIHTSDHECLICAVRDVGKILDWQANRDFIAHARADVPDLLAALEASERKVAELQEANRVISSAERKG